MSPTDVLQAEIHRHVVTRVVVATRVKVKAVPIVVKANQQALIRRNLSNDI
jgi:hypothetical protein